MPKTRRGACARSLTRSSRTPDRSQRGACSRSLTGFFATGRSSSELYASVLTGPVLRAREFPPSLCPSLRRPSQKVCKLGVSCLITRAIPHPLIDKTSFGPECESGSDVSDGFSIPYLLFFGVWKRSPDVMSYTWKVCSPRKVPEGGFQVRWIRCLQEHSRAPWVPSILKTLHPTPSFLVITLAS